MNTSHQEGMPAEMEGMQELPSGFDTSSYRQLQYQFCPHSEHDDGPVIAAAGLEDPSTLQDILERSEALSELDRRLLVLDCVHSDDLDGRWATPMGRAIERQRPQNIKLLLDHGTNPNGVDKATLLGLAQRFRRFCEDPADLFDPGCQSTLQRLDDHLCRPQH